MRILVTGATGFIGGTFSYEASKKGYDVLGIDNFLNSERGTEKKLEKFKNFDFHELDLSIESSKLKKLISDFKPNAIVHFAGLKAVAESERNQKIYWINNLQSTLNLLEVIKETNVGFVFSSSATVYGGIGREAISEDSKLMSQSAYGSTKLAQEILISDYARAYGLNCVSLRYFNPVGCHTDKVIAENYLDSPNNLMPRILRVAKSIDEKLMVFGNDYEPIDGSGERDYIHISDLIDGHFSALKALHNLDGHNFFNLGTGKKTSVIELIKVFERINNLQINYEIVGRREGDVEVCYADPTQAEKKLNWKAKKTIEEMCKDAWDAIKDGS